MLLIEQFSDKDNDNEKQFNNKKGMTMLIMVKRFLVMMIKKTETVIMIKRIPKIIMMIMTC